MANKLTIKQRTFVQKLLETGNGTQAALAAYNTNSSDVAKVIASENLTKPNVREAIEHALEASGLTDTYISEILRKVTEAGIGVKATNSDSLRGLDMMLKLKGAYPSVTQKSAHLRVEMRNTLENKSYAELKKDLEELNKKTQELLSDIRPT